LGSLNTLQRNTDEGLRCLEPARLFYEQGGYRRMLSLTLTLIGRAYRNKGDYEAALRAFNDLLQQGEQANDLSQLALSHEEIGSVLAVEERYPEALNQYEESVRLNTSLSAAYNLAYSRMHRGNILWQLGRYEEAMADLKEASAMATNTVKPYTHLLASTQVTAAHLRLSEGQFRESKAMCRQALDLSGTQYKSIAIEAQYTLGLAETRAGAWRAGSALCEEAVEMAKKINDPQLLASALLACAEALLESGQAQR